MSDKAVYMMTCAPHPIDTEWGIAGTVARLTGEGKDVLYVVCTNGSQSSDTSMKPEEKAKIREQEQLAAAKILGVREVIFLRHPILDMGYTTELRKEILRLILEYRPEIVATCDPYYPRYLSNPDHQITARAVLDAVWPYALAPNTYPDLLDQGFQPHKVKEVLLWAAEEPNYNGDVSDTFEIKITAIRCHKSQVGDPLDSEFAQRLMERAATAARGEKYELAEAFHRIEVPPRL